MAERRDLDRRRPPSNEGLGVSTFKAGLNFGIATLTVAVS
jgi:hypothetical protein